MCLDELHEIYNLFFRVPTEGVFRPSSGSLPQTYQQYSRKVRTGSFDYDDAYSTTAQSSFASDPVYPFTPTSPLLGTGSGVHGTLYSQPHPHPQPPFIDWTQWNIQDVTPSSSPATGEGQGWRIYRTLSTRSRD